MSEEKFHGVARSKIAWYPTIDGEKCVGCGRCVEFCSHGVYGFEERDGKRWPVVKSLNSCVVYCTGCHEICPLGAISHPSKVETGKIISKLRRTLT